MGLDMEIRLVKKTNRRITKTLMEGQGRGEFSWLRDWVGSDRYGEFIELNSAMAQELLQKALEQESMSKESDLFELDPDNSMEELVSECVVNLITDEYVYGTQKAIAILSLWQCFDRNGWILTIECDW